MTNKRRFGRVRQLASGRWHATGTTTEKRLMKINKRTEETASDLQLRLGGAKGTRTPDPLLAKVEGAGQWPAVYQVTCAGPWPLATVADRLALS